MSKPILKVEREKSKKPLVQSIWALGRSLTSRLQFTWQCFLKEDTEAVLHIDASNTFNSLNRNVALHSIQFTCPKLSTSHTEPPLTCTLMVKLFYHRREPPKGILWLHCKNCLIKMTTSKGYCSFRIH